MTMAAATVATRVTERERWEWGRAWMAIFVPLAAVAACADPGGDLPTAYGDSATQGTLLWTERAMDLALEGPGLFMVGEGTDRRYVRGGRFRLDERSALVDEHGRALQAYATGTDEGNWGKPLRDHLQSIVLDPMQQRPWATSDITVEGNLDAGSQTLTWPFDRYNPGATSNFATSVEIFDWNGVGHQIDIYFSKTGPNRWGWTAMVAMDRNPPAPVVDQNALGGTGELLFDDGGTLLAPGNGETAWSFPLALPGQKVRMNFAPGLRQDAAPNQTSGIRQLSGFSGRRITSVTPDGQLRAYQAEPGFSWTLAYLPVVLFPNFAGLHSTEPGVFAETTASGPPQPGDPGQEGRASPMAGFIELR